MKSIPPEMFEVTGNGEVSATIWSKDNPNLLNKLTDITSIRYLPMDVPMICFIKISFNQLKNSPHPAEYGKFGLVFTDSFLKSKGVRPVVYYTENTLWNDALIRKWNSSQNKMPRKDKADLEREILSYRKPAMLFPSFKQSVIMKLTRNIKETTLEFLTYDRYLENYDFTKENEHRIVFDEGVDYLNFDEDDLFMIITPDITAKNEVETFLRNNWSFHPIVNVYPS